MTDWLDWQKDIFCKRRNFLGQKCFYVFCNRQDPRPRNDLMKPLLQYLNNSHHTLPSILQMCGFKQVSVFVSISWSNPGLFLLYFHFLNTLDCKRSIWILQMTGFEPRTSGVVSNCSTNWATTTTQFVSLLLMVCIHFAFTCWSW